MYLYKHAYVVVISGIDLEYTASHSKILKDGLGVRLAEEAWRVHVATYGYGDRSLGEVIGLCRVVHAHSQLQHACTRATTTRMHTRNYNTHALSQLQHARTDDITATFDDRKCLLGTVHVQCTSRRHH